MLPSRLLIVLASLALVATTVLSGCAGLGAKGPELNWPLNAEPPSLDPALATDDQSIDCVEQLFLALTDIDEQSMEVIPELATEWSASADGLTWTFKMRKDVKWVHYDPETKKVKTLDTVTAHDVVYGVKRTLDPETASDYAYVDYIIKNGQAVNTGESTDLDSIGVRALDDYTVEFTLEEPAGYFGYIAGMWINRPMPKAAIDEHGDKWTEAGNMVTNGTYMLEAWEHEDKVVMVKNPNHYDAKNVQIGRINRPIVTEDSTRFAMYENGELDTAPVPQTDIDRVKADPILSKELTIQPQLSTYYYGFNVTKKPFDNVKVRQAFSYAFDRQKLIDTVTKGGQVPAVCFAPNGIFGSPAGDPSWNGILYDPAKAKALLAEAGFPEGKGLPDITLMFNTSEGHQRIAEFAQQSWKEALGVEVKLANQEWKVYLKTVNEDSPQIWRLGWGADYPDENNWVTENFHPTLSTNPPKWSVDDPEAKKFMELTEKARASSDPAERKSLYLEAEKILCVDQAIIIPIYFYTTVNCAKPYLKRSYTPFAGEHIAQWRLEEK